MDGQTDSVLTPFLDTGSKCNNLNRYYRKMLAETNDEECL